MNQRTSKIYKWKGEKMSESEKGGCALYVSKLGFECTSFIPFTDYTIKIHNVNRFYTQIQ